MYVKENVKQLNGEGAFAILSQVQQLEQQGHDVISFAIGDPDFDTPENITEAAINALTDGRTHYCQSRGTPTLRKSVAEYVSKTRAIDIKPSEVVISPGAKPIIFFAALSCIEPGDEVLYPNPGFPAYQDCINLVGGSPVALPLYEDNDFRLNVNDITNKLTKDSKMLIVNSPHNPCGSMLTRQDVEAISEIVIKHNLWLISDEIYSRLVYDQPHISFLSIPHMKERTILIDGFSKTYAMTGWRLGFGVMPEELAGAMELLIVNSVSCTPPFIQDAGVEALIGSQNSTELMRQELMERRNLMVERINKLKGIHCLSPGGAFYIYVNVTDACSELGIPNSKEFEQRLMHEAHVVVLARNAFGSRFPHEDSEYVRFSYVTDKESINKGLDRIENWLNQ